MNIKNGLVLLSNELEFWLEGINASDLIKNYYMNGGPNNIFEIEAEVNPRDALEVVISKAKNISELNQRCQKSLLEVSSLVSSSGGQIFGGAILEKSTKDINFTPYRTTTLSKPLGNGLKNIAGYQLLFGMNSLDSAKIAFESIRQLGPLILALTASSPYKIEDNNINDIDSNRIASIYPNMFKEFPEMMWGTSFPLHNLKDWFKYMAKANSQCYDKFVQNKFTIDPRFHKMSYKGGFEQPTHLAPHQFYWTTRPRFDHVSNGDPKSIMSIEFRLADMPLNPLLISAINSYMVGLVSKSLDDKRPILCDDFISREVLHETEMEAAHNGINGRYIALENVSIAELTHKLVADATNYLPNELAQVMKTTIEDVLDHGNGAARLRQEFRGDKKLNSNKLIAYKSSLWQSCMDSIDSI